MMMFANRRFLNWVIVSMSTLSVSLFMAPEVWDNAPYEWLFRNFPPEVGAGVLMVIAALALIARVKDDFRFLILAVAGFVVVQALFAISILEIASGSSQERTSVAIAAALQWLGYAYFGIVALNNGGEKR